VPFPSLPSLQYTLLRSPPIQDRIHSESLSLTFV
jgi:hypothetical protein